MKAVVLVKLNINFIKAITALL